MSGPLTRRALRRSLAQIRHVSPVPPSAARGLAAAVYSQVERDFGMLAPPVALHSPASAAMAACWLMLRETLLAAGAASREAKETVAVAVSLANTCPYCITVHSTALRGLRGDGAVAAIAGDGVESIAEPRLGDIAAWARRSAPRGQPLSHGAPFPAEQAAELAGVAVTFQYLNRMVNVFLDESPLPPGVPDPVGRGLMRVLGSIMRSAARRGPEAGASLGLLPAAPLPADMSWAIGSPHVASAFARAAEAVDAAGVSAVPASVRELLDGELAAWTGLPPGPRRAWADDRTRGLPVADRPAGRLALLTAFASYQVSLADIGEFRRGRPDDASLIELTSWASLAAARTAGTWLTPSSGQREMPAADVGLRGRRAAIKEVRERRRRDDD